MKNKVKKSKFKEFFKSKFSFESNVDLTDDTSVLVRKNIVIKNIVFVSNIVYTLISLITLIGERSNILLTVVFLPLTFLINFSLNKTLKDVKNHTKQRVAMYFCCFYMFLSAMLIYIKFKVGNSNIDNAYAESGYILLYYSLVVCSFYQDKQMMKTIGIWSFVLFTIIHFSISYNFLFGQEVGINNILDLLSNPRFKDIMLRSVILATFNLVLYLSVSMSDYLQKERKSELIKRRDVENDFKAVITDIFKTTLTDKYRTKKDISDIYLLSEMAYKLSDCLGKSSSESNEIKEFSTLHIDKSVNFFAGDNYSIEDNYNMIKDEIALGSLIIKRLELERIIEDIIRAHLEGSNSDEFSANSRNKIAPFRSQVIALCDMYITLRSVRAYKRAMSHDATISILDKQFRIYFDSVIFDRFLRYEQDFLYMYTNSN